MEFGSNFELKLKISKRNKIGGSLKENCYFFNSARIGLKVLLEELNIENVYIPNYLCEVVYDCFKEKIIEFYQLDQRFEYCSGLENVKGNSIIFISNYFGLSSEKKLIKLLKEIKKEKNLTIIYDITHSLFSEKNNELVDYYIASFRKWLPVPDGAVVLSDKKLEIKYEECEHNFESKFVYASVLKLLYVNSKVQNPRINQKYREIFEESENKLSEIEDVYTVSDYSKEYFKLFDRSVLCKRIKNYNVLRKLIKNPQISLCYNNYLRGEVIPFNMPILCKNRNELRKYLIENKVYCAIHWNQDFMPKMVRKQDVSNSILSLPIDERYTTKDMKILAKIINKFGEKRV